MARAHDLFFKLSLAIKASSVFRWSLKWKDLIQPGTRYMEIIQYLIKDAEKKDNFNYYREPGDIVRFVAAVFHHYNDNVKDPSKFKTEEQLERDLSKMFPALYETLDFAVRYVRERTNGNLHWEDLLSVATPSQ